MVGVSLNFGLTRVAFAPVPLLLQFSRERIRVFDAFNIDSGARVSIPIPGAAHALTHLVTLNAEATLPRAIDHVQASEPGADDDHVDLLLSTCGHDESRFCRGMNMTPYQSLGRGVTGGFFWSLR